MKYLKKILTALLNSFYLFGLYFKRGALKSLFYFFILMLIAVIVGFLLETNAKVDKMVEGVNKILPVDRIKIGIPQKVYNPNSGLLSLFGGKDEKKPKTKDFIKPSLIKQVREIPGVKNIIPLYNVDFPTGVEFSFPGSGSVFRAEAIGIGMPPLYAKPYIQVKNKNFNQQGGEVPVLVATYLLQVFNMILENNNIGFKIDEKNVIGFTFNLVIGNSFMSSGGQNGFRDIVKCRVVGFIDMDYTYGVAFPAPFIEKYKKVFWGNFKPGHYDSLMLEVAIDHLNEVEKRVQSKGFFIKDDSQIMKKISTFINQNQAGLAIFLKFISAIILLMGLIISFYTVFWMLRDKGVEFSLYRFFGSSNFKILILYGAYISVINFLSVLISFFILKKLFLEMGKYLLQFKDKIPMGFQSVLDPNFILNPLILNQFLSFSFVFMEISVFSMIVIYLAGLNKRL